MNTNSRVNNVTSPIFPLPPIFPHAHICAMTNRHLVILLLPTFALVAIVCYLLHMAHVIYPDRHLADHNVADLIAQAQKSGFGNNCERVVELLKTSVHTRVEMLESLSEFETITGYGLLIGIGLQAFLIIAFRRNLTTRANAKG
jgi:hypothetical protein